MSSAVVSEMLIRIAADTAQLRSEMEQVKRQTGGAFSEVKNQAMSLRSEMIGVVRDIALAVGALNLAKKFVETADAMSLMDARLKTTTGTAENFAVAQKEIYRIAQANNVGIEEATQLFTKLNEPVKRLGGGVKETSAIVDAFSMSLRLGGANTQEAAAATLQFAQAMGSGRLQGDEFRSLAEASPRFMKAMADGMNVPIEKLKQMGSDGKLTADIVGNALIKSLGALQKEAASMPDTVGGAMTRIKNDIIIAIDDLNKNSGLTLGIASLLSGVRDLIPAIKDELGGSFKAVGDWINENKEGIAELWGIAKQLGAEVWDLAKGFATVLGFIVQNGIKSGEYKVILEGIRFVVAGIKDGAEILFATFALMGAQILKVFGIFSDAAADAAKKAEEAGLAVYERFAKGDTHVMKLANDLANVTEESKKAGDVAKQHGAAMEAQGKAADGTSQALVKLKNKNVELTKEEKEGIEHYKKATSAITEKTLEMNKEIDTGEKMTEGQKMALKIMEQVRDGEIKFIATKKQTVEQQKIALATRLDEMLAAERAAKESEKERDALKEVMKDREKHIETMIKEADTMNESTKKQLDENYAMQYGKEALELLEISRLKEQRATMAEIVAREQLLGYCTAETLAHERTLEALNNLISARESGVHLKAAKEAADEWTKTADTINQSLTDSLMRAFESGKGFATTFKEGMVNMFKTMVLQPTIKFLMQPITAGIGSLFGAGNATAGTGGGASGLGSLLSGGKSIWDILQGGFTGIGNSIAFGAQDMGAWLMNNTSGFANQAGGWLMGNSNMLGTIGSYGTGALAGMGIGNLISGQYSAIGGNSSITTGIATALGAALGGPLGAALGGTIGGLVNRAFGMGSKEYKGGGIMGTIGQYGAVGQSFKDWHQDGGWFRSDKNGTDYSALSPEILSMLTDGGKAILDTTVSLAQSLKLPIESLQQIKVDFREQLTGDAAKDKEIMTGVFQQYQDALANSMADVLTPFQHTGEALYDTLQRLASVQLSREMLNQFGGIFSKIASSGVEATEAMIKLAGGLDALTAKATQFVSDYYSEQEKAGMAAKSLLDQLKAVGIDASGLDSKEAYRKLVESMNVQDENQRKQLDALLTLGPQFAQIAAFMQENKMTLAEVSQFAPLVAVLDPMFQQQVDAAADSTNAIDSTTAAVDGVATAVQNGTTATVAAINSLASTIAGAVAQAAASGAAASAAVTARLSDIEATARLAAAAPYSA